MKWLISILAIAAIMVACNPTARFIDCLDGCSKDNVDTSEVIVIDNTPEPTEPITVQGLIEEKGFATSASSDPLTTCADLTGQDLTALQKQAREHALAVGGATAYWYTRYEANDKSYTAAGSSAYASRPFLSDLVSGEYKAYIDAGGEEIVVPAKFKTSLGSGCTTGRIQSVHGSMKTDYNGSPAGASTPWL